MNSKPSEQERREAVLARADELAATVSSRRAEVSLLASSPGVQVAEVLEGAANNSWAAIQRCWRCITIDGDGGSVGAGDGYCDDCSVGDDDDDDASGDDIDGDD